MRLNNISLTCLLTVAMLLTISTVAASIFELETVSLQELHDNPEVYDSTTAYHKISISGNISELSRTSVIIADDGYSIRIKGTQQSQFSGFEVGDGIKLNGEFRYEHITGGYFIPTYLMHYPTETMENTTVQQVIGNPAEFNGKFITITANLQSIDESTGNYIVVVTDKETGKTMKVTYFGTTDLKPDTVIEISGLYNNGVLYSENIAKYKPPMSLTTLIPGFTGLGTLIIVGILGIFIRYQHSE